MNEPSRRGRGALRVERRPRPRSNAPSRRHLDVTDAAAALKARGGAPLRANDDLDAPGPPRVRRGPGAQRQRFVYGRPDDGEAAARRQQGLGGRARPAPDPLLSLTRRHGEEARQRPAEG